uniref:Uncharacterized protein n=1 Tax=viral metagenome TaxID=1070528 RepID=A0A6C0JBK9_9ZZZZ
MEFNNFNVLIPSTITVNVESNINFDLKNIIVYFKHIIKNNNCVNKNCYYQFKNTQNILNKQLVEKDCSKYENSFTPGTIVYIRYNDFWSGIKTSKTDKLGFNNQISFKIFINKGYYINIMMFENGRLKMAGCKNNNDSVFVMAILWQYVNERTKQIINPFLDSLKLPSDKTPVFVFTNEMMNIPFRFSRTLNKVKVNTIFNNIKDGNILSYYEPTGQHCVNIKLLNDVKNRTAIILCILSPNNFVVFIKDVLCKIKKQEFDRTGTSFMVFPNNVIMSGNGIDFEILKNDYNKFTKILQKNASDIVL